MDGLNEQQKAERKEELERRRYGRLWMQEGYFNEKNSQEWLKAAEILKTVNEHVLEDIEDFILLEGFAGTDKAKIADIVEADQLQRIKEQKALLPKGKDDQFYKAALEEMKKRKFLDQMRPPKVWGFKQDPSEAPVKHVLRAEADPRACYTDGRIEAVLASVDSFAKDLQTYNPESWSTLTKHTLSVFVDEQEKHVKALSAPKEAD